MTNSQRLATVRAHLLRWLAENVAPEPLEIGEELALAGDKSDEPSQVEPCETPSNPNGNQTRVVSESILIRDGFYAGRTFDATAQGEFFRATWFMEPDELKIHASGGAVVAVFQGAEISTDVHDQTEATEQTDAVEEGPVSIPMPAADESPQPQPDVDSDDDGIRKAA